MNILKTYPFWLCIISCIVMTAERITPWRKNQKLFRPELLQDVIWLIFNGIISSIVFAFIFDQIYLLINSLFYTFLSIYPTDIAFFKDLPFLAQVFLFLVIADFLEWCIHFLLHRVPLLWKFHRVHHSITTMDWIGNFRFHWMEIFIYNTLKYLPLTLLGAHPDAIFIVAILSTFIGHLNHSNLHITWGPFRYIINSPGMHIWHHEKKVRNRVGVNFAVVLSVWDWMFRTAYMPLKPEAPEEIGFTGQERVSKKLYMRFFLPFIDTE